MPINAASESIHLPDALAQEHDVQFFVQSNLIAPRTLEDLHGHLKEHQAFLREQMAKGLIHVVGPFFTTDGENTGDGFYILRVDSAEAAAAIAAQDPMHRNHIRAYSVKPWLEMVA